MTGPAPWSVWLLALSLMLCAAWIASHPKGPEPPAAARAGLEGKRPAVTAPPTPGQDAASTARASASDRPATHGAPPVPDAGSATVASPDATRPPATGRTALAAPISNSQTTAAEDFIAEQDRLRRESIERDTGRQMAREHITSGGVDVWRCGPRNFTSGVLVDGVGIAGELGVVADGLCASEGTVWSAPVAVRWTDPVAYARIDLVSVHEVDGLLFQGDNNDRYLVEGSLDGFSYRELWWVPSDPKPGLRTRRVAFGRSERVRYLRVTASFGDGRYSVSELAASTR